ncbi:hypothetical protein HK101_005832, partial [Irineochytrium annulatum]
MQTDRILPILPPGIILSNDPQNMRILAGPPNAHQAAWSLSQHTADCRETILTALSWTRSDPHRVLYALASRAFLPEGPRPIGGKRAPGYQQFRCVDPVDVLDWLLYVSLDPKWEVGRRRPPHPSTLLCFVAGAVNEVLAMHLETLDPDNAEARSRFDDAVLLGMKRAGHLSRIGEHT